MGSSENKTLIRGMYSALAAGEPEGFLSALDEAVQWTIIGTTPLSKTFDGKKQLVEELLEPFMKDLEGAAEIVPENFIAEGDFVAMQSTGKARTKAGVDYNNTYCHVFRIRDGKVLEVTEYLDTELVRAAF